jgi:hypothetical protein
MGYFDSLKVSIKQKYIGKPCKVWPCGYYVTTEEEYLIDPTKEETEGNQIKINITVQK